MNYQDYYATLGVDKAASADDIKKQYRRLARKYHPDVSKEENAEAKFKEVKEAYEVLKDPGKRQAYDQLGKDWQNKQSGFEPPPGWEYQQQTQNNNHGFHSQADFSDFFESMFGQGAAHRAHGNRHHHYEQRGEDKHSSVSITLNQAYHGCELMLTLQDAIINEHTGQVERKSRNLKVRIPAGVINHQQIRLVGQGGEGFGGGKNGDLFLEVSIQPNNNYKLDGKDVTLTLPVTPWEAALGATISVPTLGGNVNLKIPPHSQSGQKMRLKGRGLPSKSPGDQYVILSIHIPEPKTAEQKALYEQMAKALPFDPRAAMTGDQS